MQYEHTMHIPRMHNGSNGLMVVSLWVLKLLEAVRQAALCTIQPTLGRWSGCLDEAGPSSLSSVTSKRASIMLKEVQHLHHDSEEPTQVSCNRWQKAGGCLEEGWRNRQEARSS